MINATTIKKQGIHCTFWNIQKFIDKSQNTLHAAGGKSQAFIDLSIAVKNIHMPRVKNTIPPAFFVVSLFVARLRWCHGSRGGAIITTRE